jgi:DNA (cytosine-5)-methyltransferase 1
MLAYDGHEASSHHIPGGHLMAASLPVLSLFSGAGCLDLAVERCAEPFGANGMRTEGPFRVAVATDHDARALRSLQANFPRVPTICGDIRDLSTRDFLDKAGVAKGEAELVVGGPPCTPFSKSGFWLEEKRSSSDPNASLLDEYARIVTEAQPRAFVLENVQGLTYATHRAQLNRVLEQLTRAGYRPTYRVLMAADYGDPQLRRRVFVVGRRDGEDFRFPEPTHSGWSEHTRVFDPAKEPYVTAASAIGSLLSDPFELGEIVEGTYADLLAEVPPGQNYLWHTERYGGRDVFKWRSRYWTFLLRLDPDRPSSTLQAQPGPWVGPFHWQNVINAEGISRARRLSKAELLRLMSLPDDFLVEGDSATIRRQLGNAVPLELGKTVVGALAEQLGVLSRPAERRDDRDAVLAAGVSGVSA